MPFFSNLKKVLSLGSGSDSALLNSSSSKKKKSQILSRIKCDQDPESNWDIIGELGDGAFGKVQKVRSRENPELLAAAKVCVLESDEELEDFLVEIDILSELSHRNIVKLYEAYFHLNKLWVRNFETFFYLGNFSPV